ncbi:hypothetical protein [Microcystis sp. LEGE 00066]|uniref:hypothetical protein n=1 Tax=Microcystis sp. LEGE 00066 TaxID=1828685 RepID=UPI001D15532B|nr:hypothetical protein [Microcystis sp. LEGE 00066]
MPPYRTITSNEEPKYFTQFIPGKQEGYATTTKSLPDVRGLRVFSFDLPVGSVVYADKADNDYETEDLLLEAEHIQLSAMRKHNSKYLLILLRYLTFSGNLSCN